MARVLKYLLLDIKLIQRSWGTFDMPSTALFQAEMRAQVLIIFNLFNNHV